ncbi:MAG TPA: hypothetical protein VH327_07320, partial [Gammaproteobacteria bacterium]|nr:hypothetical protein [Gammaproteobacteria bacterium]
MRHRRLLILVLLCAAATAARADDLYDGASTYLDLGAFDTAWTYPDGEHTAQVGRYGIAFSTPLGGDVSAELHGGYATLDVDGEPQPQPVEFTGRYLGLMARYEGTDGDYFNLSAELAYTWHDVNGGNFNVQPSEMVWYETWAAFGPVLRYERWRLSFGAYLQNLRGNETDDQPARELDFHSRR